VLIRSPHLDDDDEDQEGEPEQGIEVIETKVTLAELESEDLPFSGGFPFSSSSSANLSRASRYSSITLST
jgi:hypothetical protein